MKCEKCGKEDIFGIWDLELDTITCCKCNGYEGE